MLMSYGVDYLKQCLVACVWQNQCPACLVLAKLRSSAPNTWPPRAQPKIIGILAVGDSHQKFKVHGLNDVVELFRALPPTQLLTRHCVGHSGTSDTTRVT
ncbi:hypothetical protein AURDEDRAFT_51771 [Auricularia subglabra TFB-10046 SS5]|nr:hypothetical protein AURDEDRAFT_51771 [Auricularia subglabra TFB-10046 SS5]